MVSGSNEKPCDIALWGPTGSGKTWLIYSLAQELKTYNRKDREFQYRLTDDDDQPVSVSKPEDKPTDRAEDRLWRFARIPHPGATIKPERIAVSCHTHNINVHDDAGINLTEAVYNPDDTSVATNSLLESPYLVVLLDPTLVDGSDLASLAIKPDSVMAINDYCHMVTSLCSMLSQYPVKDNTSRLMAVCLSKTDLTGLRRDPKNMIRIFFGQDLLDEIEHFSNKINLKFFTFSSAGYYQDGGRRIPNYDNNTRELAKEKNWQPQNTVAPFFWMFEEIERQRLAAGDKRRMSNRLNLYSPYPRPKI